VAERAACTDDYRLLERVAADPQSDDGDDLMIARGFYERGLIAGLAGKDGWPMMTASDVFFYRGWRRGRGRVAGIPNEDRAYARVNARAPRGKVPEMERMAAQ
jgi:hypothetical protein